MTASTGPVIPASLSGHFPEHVRFVHEIIARLLDDVGRSGRRWAGLIAHLEQLGRDDATPALDLLEGIPARDFSESDRAQVRTALRECISSHRRHPDARWELTAADIDRMVVLYEAFAPSDPIECVAWLFGPRPALLEGREDDVREHWDRIRSHRVEAVRMLHRDHGLGAVLELARRVDRPGDVGAALAACDVVEDEPALLREHLAAGDPVVATFGSGLALGVVRRRGGEWARCVVRSAIEWRPEQRAELLCCLPLEDATWSVVDALDDSTRESFWCRAPLVWLLWVPPERVEYFVRNLLRCGRAWGAVDHLAMMAWAKDKPPPSPELIADALEAMFTSERHPEDPLPSSGDLSKLTESLADAPGAVPLPRIASIEWQLVGVLGHDQMHPRVPHADLSRKPEFFVEIVSLIHPAEDEEPRELTQQENLRRRAAYELLESWRTLPCSGPDGSLDGSELAQWVRSAREGLRDARRSGDGDTAIGGVLASSPPGEDGAWPHEAVREVLEQEQSRDIEEAVDRTVFNRRGMVRRTLDEGGAQERALADRYGGYARMMTDRWPRTASLLRGMAERYASLAAQKDTERELRQQLERA